MTCGAVAWHLAFGCFLSSGMRGTWLVVFGKFYELVEVSWDLIWKLDRWGEWVACIHSCGGWLGRSTVAKAVTVTSLLLLLQGTPLNSTQSAWYDQSSSHQDTMVTILNHVRVEIVNKYRWREGKIMQQPIAMTPDLRGLSIVSRVLDRYVAGVYFMAVSPNWQSRPNRPRTRSSFYFQPCMSGRVYWVLKRRMAQCPR